MLQKYMEPPTIDDIDNLEKVQRFAMRVHVSATVGPKAGRTTVSIWPYNSRDKKINCKNVSVLVDFPNPWLKEERLSTIAVQFMGSPWYQLDFEHQCTNTHSSHTL